MNKQNVKRALGVFALSLAVFGAALPSAKVTASAAITETNGCYTMVAAGTETADGVTVAYFNNSSDFMFEFDLI